MCEFLREMIEITPEMRSFLSEHANDDTTRLLLSASRYPGIDVRWAVEQIEARKQIRYKLPEWYAMSDRLVMGGRIPAEQCSSEQTARYKRQLVTGASLCDLTSGMGVDLYYMSRGLERAIYTERQTHLCEAARHNFAELGATNIEVREGDAIELGIPDVDTLYLDPARRASDGRRVYDLTDCEPNVVVLREELLRHCRRLVIKVSPMADLTRIQEQMPGLTEIHIVAVKNECKELLLVIDNDLERGETQAPVVHCVDFRTNDEVRFDFRVTEEQEGSMEQPAESGPIVLNGYLYEPDVTLLKAGAFRLLERRYGVRQVGTNSHLYLSDNLINDFPGRVFAVDEVKGFSGKLLKGLKTEIPQANIATRNFPLSADELRKRTGIKDGGDCYLFGTTMTGFGARLFRCHKALTLLLVVLLSLPSFVYARKKKNVEQQTVENLVSGVKLESPCLWNQGTPFLYLDSLLSPTLVPQIPDPGFDTLCYYRSLWTFDGILSEEDWMGQQRMMLQFRSPQNRIYRFSTGRLMKQMNDTTYHPALSSLIALAPIEECDRRLRGKSLYLMINDERCLTADSLLLEKFVPVTIDSVTVGNENAPLHVWFSHPQGKGSVLTSLPDSRETATSTVLQKFFSLEDPYLRYPNITAETWALIRANKVKIDMNLEEVRLSLGRPQRYEHYNTKGGMIERWHYADRKVLDFIDGRLRRVAIER